MNHEHQDDVFARSGADFRADWPGSGGRVADRGKARAARTEPPGPRPAPGPDDGFGMPVPLSGPVELHTERAERSGPVVWVPDAYGRMVPMPKDQIIRPAAAVPVPVAPPAAGPRVDPVAQRLVGGAALAAGTGWGTSMVLDQLTASATGLGLLLGAYVLNKLAGPRGGRGDTHITTITTTHHVTNRWWGRSTTHTHIRNQ
ncbi:hypothetical protein RKE29_05765 [Streptomyces sp. B1866]|uniref:hypothetical protein n=1 Tax=Streptomyces sp. B1866 TaxID=3075431 RepID=UPI00288D6FBF|nr:hypothetical protein [Streptomyces sp. B1866]MDT3396151.1 hypothetical protein [Streptomyces sp. B1866]